MKIKSEGSRGTLLVYLGGTGKLGQHLPGVEAVWKKVDSDGQVKRMAFDTSRIHSWDSGLLNFLLKLFEERSRKEVVRDPFRVRVGSKAVGLFGSATEQLGFLGEAFLVFFQFLRGKAQFQRSEFFLILQECGAQALPIVSLISVLVGLILDFVGAVQLMMFGAQIYVAHLVAIAMTRQMGGMRKRAGLARAMALDPDILFFDEPSAGLDPISAKLLDDLMLELRESLGTTLVVVTHELASIFAIGNNSVFLDAETKTMIGAGDPKKLVRESPNPKVREFLTRGKAGKKNGKPTSA